MAAMAAAMNAPRLEALHFGHDQRLFGLRSEPLTRPRETAIVICQSWGAEGMRSYRGLHLLAQQLAERGFETLRFDYTGTGDSADADHTPLSQWLDDIRDAANELRELSGARRIALLGLRLGALLASQAAQAAQADELLLWDAPDSGQQWSEQMLALNRQQLARKNRTRPAALQLDIPDDELLGSPWPADFAAAVGSLQLAGDGLPLRHFHSADSVAGDRTGELLPDASQWDELLKLDAPWVPARSITAVCDRLAEQLR
jgi:pimeloyl-ACP methyl ester carboxylesterase